MPLTFPAHQGLILPVARRWLGYFDTLALSVGAAMPDITGSALGFLEHPPAGRHAAEDGADPHLGRGARIGGDGESAADLAELASLRDVQATFT